MLGKSLRMAAFGRSSAALCLVSRAEVRLGCRASFAGFPGVDGMVQRTAAEERETMAQDLTKNSTLRALVIGVDVLCGSNVIVSRDARFLDSGSPASVDAVDAHTAAATAKKVPKKATEILGVTDVKTKYMAKLGQKLAGKGGAIAAVAREASSRGDAELLKLGQISAAKQDQDVAKTAGAWMLSSGMGPLLDYCQQRTMHLGLFPTFTTTAELIEQFVHTVNTVNFTYVSPTLLSQHEALNDIDRRERKRRAITALESMLTESSGAMKGTNPKQILLVSTDDIILSAGKELGLFTVKYRAPQGLYGQVTTDFNATSAVEVQDALEELNGIALRGSAFSFRSM